MKLLALLLVLATLGCVAKRHPDVQPHWHQSIGNNGAIILSDPCPKGYVCVLDGTISSDGNDNARARCVWSKK